MHFRDYDPLKVSVRVNTKEITGFADGDFVSTSTNSDLINPYVGSKGDTTVAINRDATGEVVITVQRNSPVVAELNALFMVNGVFNLTSGFLITIHDPSTYVKVVATNCYLRKAPDVSWGTDAGTLEYRFWCASIVNDANTAINAISTFGAGSGITG